MQKAILASLVMAAVLSPVAAFATDGKIDITGRVAAQVCTVNAGSPDFTVTLPKVATSALAGKGARAGSTPFTIRLHNCNPPSGGIRASFDAGPNVDVSTGRLNLTASSDNSSASNVQIVLTTVDGTDIKIGAGAGAQGTSFVEIETSTAELTYVAQYVATGAVTAGTTKTSVTYSMEYE